MLGMQRLHGWCWVGVTGEGKGLKAGIGDCAGLEGSGGDVGGGG